MGCPQNADAKGHLKPSQGLSAPWPDPQSQKGNAELQWAHCDPQHKAWLGRLHLSFEHDRGITKGRNLLSDFSVVTTPMKNTTTSTMGAADLYLCKAVTFRSARALHLCPFNTLTLPLQDQLPVPHLP